MNVTGMRQSAADFSANPFVPYVGTVLEVIDETPAIKTFRVLLDDREAWERFTFIPGQVAQLSIFGVGEATFVINSPPSRREYLQFSVMRAGEVTSRLHGLSAGDKVGVRGPLGNGFDVESMKGKNIFFVGGGIGMAPLRTLFLHMLDHRGDFGAISLLYGARSPQDLSYSYELPQWLGREDLAVTLTVDREAPDWPHRVGLIPHVLADLAPSSDNAVAVVCGPPIMIRFTVEALRKLGFEPRNIVTTLEKRMKCGVGLCGRCNIGSKYVCVDGPVFTLAELQDLPDEL